MRVTMSFAVAASNARGFDYDAVFARAREIGSQGADHAP